MRASCFHSFVFDDHLWAPLSDGACVLGCSACGAIFDTERGAWLRN